MMLFKRLPMTPFHRFWYHFWQLAIYVTLKTFFRLRGHGLEHVPAAGGGLMVSNHASNLDPPLIGCLPRHRRPHYFAKIELFSFLPLDLMITSMNAHPVRRGGVDRAAMRKAVEIMRAGHMLLAFPEGTRTRDGNLQPPKPGVAMMAIQADVPCIPVYIHGSFHAWPRDRKLPRLTPVHVYFGESFRLPERTEGMASREHYEICANEMMVHIDALRQKAEAENQQKQKGSDSR